MNLNLSNNKAPRKLSFQQMNAQLFEIQTDYATTDSHCVTYSHQKFPYQSKDTTAQIDDSDQLN